jgi:hypothetical protein
VKCQRIISYPVKEYGTSIRYTSSGERKYLTLKGENRKKAAFLHYYEVVVVMSFPFPAAIHHGYWLQEFALNKPPSCGIRIRIRGLALPEYARYANYGTLIRK